MKREAAIGISIEHPQVIRIYGIQNFQGEDYLLMEFLPDGSLQDVIRSREKYLYSQLVALCTQCARGLAYLHAKKILYRDLKPTNILFSGNRAVLTDFGLSWQSGLKDAKEPPPRSGTPKYMSPEQIKGLELAPTSDIYSFGIILYELFTGEFVMEVLDAVDRAKQVKSLTSSSFENPQKVNPNIPDDLNGIIRKCLYTSRRARFSTGYDLIRAFESLRSRSFKKE